MTPERWQRVKELFESALERAPDERPAFLDQACDGDESLRTEVQSLLASYQEGESFMERPAVALAAETLAGSRSESPIGQTIGHYQVIREIGSGGMGEVYLAQDIRLGRHVALKLLPTYLSKDEDRLRRFEQEARTASALDHPNVCVIHEVRETEDDRHYIAMEYVDGVTLRQHMTEARLKLGEVLDVAVQVASGLAAAHEVGVMHRDIKPENIMLRRDGYVKVLDFGLAKLTEQETTDVAATPGARVTTDTGVVMGTSRYMSPEQVRGLAVDARTDIWSLGVVLYEMVTTRVPFEGATTSDVIVSILEREPPPLAQFSPAAPAELQRIIAKALHKDREGRYQTAKELLIDVRNLKQDVELEAKLEHSQQPGSSRRRVLRTSATTSAALRQPRWWANRLIWPSAVVILVVAVAVSFYLARAPSESSTRSSSKSSLPPVKVVSFTSFSGREFDPTFSPDGNQIAFIWDGVKGDNFDIYVKLINAGTPLRLTTHPGVDHSPAWSPDGRYLAFFRHSESEQGIFIVPALGGTERKLYSPDWEPSTGVAGAGNRIGNNAQVVWSPNGKYLAFMDSSAPQTSYSIWLLSVENLERRRLTWPPPQYSGGDTWPAFSPDSQTLAFARWSSAWLVDIYIVPIGGGEPRRLTFDNRPISRLAWTPDGREIVFSSDRAGDFGLWRISISGGTPERLAVGGDNASQLSISRQGNRLAYVQELYDANIWRIELPNSKVGSNSPTKLIASTMSEEGPQYSPDGKRMVFESGQRGNSEIWVCDSDGTNPIQLTSYDRLTGTPRWSPDGRHIAFDSRAESHSDIYVTSAEGGSPRRITTGTSDDVVPSWSRDGQWIYFASNRTGDNQVWKAPAGGGEAVQVTREGGFAAFESPDGKFIYYAKGQSAPGIWRIPVAGGEETLVLNQPAAGYWGYWAVVDEGIYFLNSESKQHPVIEFFRFATRRVRQIAVMEKEAAKWNPGFAISPDGRWILYTQVDQSDSNIMLVENFQ
jgi:Tol biopolymer transport system component/predicted Ser/Thr protein kinase